MRLSARNRYHTFIRQVLFMEMIRLVIVKKKLFFFTVTALLLVHMKNYNVANSSINKVGFSAFLLGSNGP